MGENEATAQAILRPPPRCVKAEQNISERYSQRKADLLKVLTPNVPGRDRILGFELDPDPGTPEALGSIENFGLGGW